MEYEVGMDAIDDLFTVDVTKEKKRNFTANATDENSNRTRPYAPSCDVHAMKSKSPLRGILTSCCYPLTPSLRIDGALPAHLVRRSRLLRLRRFHTIARIDQALHQEWPSNYSNH